MGIREWVMLITLSILWGGSFFFVEVVVDQLPPLTIVLLRVGLAAIALWIFAFSIGLRAPTSATVWLAFFIMGMINNVIPFSLLVWGQTHIASGLASILNATTPLFTVVVAGVLLTDERITPAKLTGVAFGLGGVILMIGPEALAGFSSNVLAQMAILGTAISYAFASVYGRRFKTMGLNPVMLATGQVTASSLILLPVVFYIDRPQNLPLPGTISIASILALGVFSTAAGLYSLLPHSRRRGRHQPDAGHFPGSGVGDSTGIAGARRSAAADSPWRHVSDRLRSDRHRWQTIEVAQTRRRELGLIEFAGRRKPARRRGQPPS
jgi:drug/metabolite transporter (DMT)-like permease